MSNFQKELKYLSSVRIKQTTKNFIQISCPICGEGTSNTKFRGFILKRDDDSYASYYCHNDENCNRPFSKFLEAIGQDPKAYLSEFRHSKVQKFIRKSKKRLSDDVLDELLEEMGDLGESSTVEKPFGIDLTLKPLTDTFEFTYSEGSELVRCVPLEDNLTALNYIKSRRIPSSRWPNILYSVKKKMIIIPFMFLGQVYGFQARSIFEKRFHNELYGDNPKIYGLEDIWNAHKANKKVYLFESIFNAYSVDLAYVGGIIGTTVPSTILTPLRYDKVVFCLDNDKKGVSATSVYIKKGFSYVRYLNKNEDDWNDMLAYSDSKKLAKFIKDNTKSGGFGSVLSMKMERGLRTW